MPASGSARAQALDAKAGCARFDEFADSYRRLLDQGVRLSGETSGYFDRYKLELIGRFAGALPEGATVLDFGCGIGSLTALVAGAWPRWRVHGYDVSEQSISRARREWATLGNLSFHSSLPSDVCFDLVVVANVFHHVPIPERPGLLLALRERLGPQGRVFVVEHNPLNPLTRHVVRHCPFDRDAALIPMHGFVRLGGQCGLEVRESFFVVFFPRFLRWLRWLEPVLGWLPMGAQYCLTLEPR
jgi:SAM-dependent methyltransferase